MAHVLLPNALILKLSHNKHANNLRVSRSYSQKSTYVWKEYEFGAREYQVKIKLYCNYVAPVFLKLFLSRKSVCMFVCLFVCFFVCVSVCVLPQAIKSCSCEE